MSDFGRPLDDDIKGRLKTLKKLIEKGNRLGVKGLEQDQTIKLVQSLMNVLMGGDVARFTAEIGSEEALAPYELIREAANAALLPVEAQERFAVARFNGQNANLSIDLTNARWNADQTEINNRIFEFGVTALQDERDQAALVEMKRIHKVGYKQWFSEQFDLLTEAGHFVDAGFVESYEKRTGETFPTNAEEALASFGDEAENLVGLGPGMVFIHKGEYFGHSSIDKSLFGTMPETKVTEFVDSIPADTFAAGRHPGHARGGARVAPRQRGHRRRHLHLAEGLQARRGGG